MTITIPPAALEAAARAIAATDCPASLFDTCENYGGCMCRERARAAALALLEAWPGITGVHASDISPAVLILPLNTETDNDKA